MRIDKALILATPRAPFTPSIVTTHKETSQSKGQTVSKNLFNGSGPPFRTPPSQQYMTTQPSDLMNLII